jgi:hypothetical protein
MWRSVNDARVNVVRRLAGPHAAAGRVATLIYQVATTTHH